MHKSLKIIILVVSIFLALSGAAVWYVSSAINPAQLTKILSSTVKSTTGRDLVISGPVSLKLFPSISVTADQVSFSNAPWASDKQMFTLKHVEMDIRLLPLIKGDVEISRIKLAGLDAHLQTNSAGEVNWGTTALVAIVSQPTVDGASKEGSNSSDSDSNPFMTIETLDISDSRISTRKIKAHLQNFCSLN